jgi:hypothetical protein
MMHLYCYFTCLRFNYVRLGAIWEVAVSSVVKRSLPLFPTPLALPQKAHHHQPYRPAASAHGPAQALHLQAAAAGRADGITQQVTSGCPQGALDLGPVALGHQGTHMAARQAGVAQRPGQPLASPEDQAAIMDESGADTFRQPQGPSFPTSPQVYGFAFPP